MFTIYIYIYLYVKNIIDFLDFILFNTKKLL